MNFGNQILTIMRFYQISYKKLIFISFSLLCMLFSNESNAQRKAEKKGSTINVNLKVVNESGTVIPNAQVVIGEGLKHTETDKNGNLSIQGTTSEVVTISVSGYEKAATNIAALLTVGTVKLVKSKLFGTSEDVVSLPFMETKKRSLTGSSTVIHSNQLDKYPSVDLRNAFTGLATGLEVIEKYGATGISSEEKLGNFGAKEKVSMLIRGRSPLIMIDNIPSDLTEIQLDPQEIESVTVVKDIVEKSMFGPQAADGIIFITTKRGKTNEKILKVNLESGTSIVDRFPEWTTGADYANLNNTARQNSSLSPLYSANAISSYSKNDPYDKYHPSINYPNLMLKNTKAFARLNLSSQGGNDKVQYFAYLGYNREGDIYKAGATADYNRLNTRANMDIKVNELMKIRFDFFGGLTFRRSPNYGYNSNYGADNSSDGTLDILEFDRALTDITTNSPIAFPIYANNDASLKAPWYGVTPDYTINPMGNITKNGYYTESARTGTISTTIDYDLSNLIKGLKSRTFFGLDASYLIRVGKATNYIAYNVVPLFTTTGADSIVKLTKSHDGVDMMNQGKLHDYYYQRMAAHETLSFDRTIGLNTVQSTLTYSIYRMTKNQIEEPQREQSLVWCGKYSFNDKYNFQAVMNYSGTYSFDENKKYALFPSVGSSWIISEENFMKGLSFINYLKLRAEIGMIGDENFNDPFLYKDNWINNTTGPVFGAYSTNQWFGTAQDNQVYRTLPGRIGTPDITWEKRKEINFGFDAVMMDQKLSIEMSYYHNVRDGQIAQLNNFFPAVAGITGANPYFNYNKTAYYGVETGLQYINKIGELRYFLGANFVVQNSKILKYDEPNYRFDYQTRIGKPADSYWGLTNIGKFTSDADAMVTPQIYDALLHKDDLKYQDMNGDNIIDDNDMSSIGHTTPHLYYGLNAKLYYKNFEMTLIGTGRALYDIPMTNKYFWNGWGDNNYSNFVKDNIGGAYPKLSYYKVNNNFVNSDFWLTKGGYFKIQNIEVAYNLRLDKIRVIGARGIRFFVRGANLLTFSKVKDVDPESINSGVDSYPLYKTFTAGINLTF
jgi:TonB-linked SusC/RagA family outer membrane protein